MSYIGNKRVVSHQRITLPFVDAATNNVIIREDGTLEGVDFTPINSQISSIQNQINSIEEDITSLDTSIGVIEDTIDQPTAPVLSFRNKIINGNFDIWQRGTSQTTTGWGSVDRWRLNLVSSGTATLSQQSFDVGQTEVPGNPKYYARVEPVTNSSSAENISIRQSIEGVETLAGQTATLSFWAKADSNKNIATEFFQLFGSGGSAQTSISPTIYNLTTSWQKFTTTFSVPSISGKTVGLNNWIGFAFFLSAGSDYNSRTNSLGNQSGTFDIAQVQLEESFVATPFEHRSLSVEEHLCQRYYQIRGVGADWHGNNWIGGNITLSPTMRIIPTRYVDDGQKNNVTLGNLVGIDANKDHWGWQIYRDSNSYRAYFWTTVRFDAEL